jgi:CTP:molybdopterin cytidylyltransferase MocA
MSVVAILLAAGGGTRFAGPTHKLLAPLRGKRVVEWAHEHAIESGLRVVVVTGAVEDLGLPGQVHNPRWQEGIATSLQAGIAAAAAAHAVVVWLGDQPFIPGEAWRLVAEVDAPIAVATYEGVGRRNPVRLARSVWPDLPATGDHGASVLFGQHDVIPVACPGDPADVDRAKDLDQWS